jgi:hypothetical protein
MARPNIVLKDKTGNPVPYEGVKQIEVLGHNWDGNAESMRFTRLSSMYCYLLKINGDETVTIQKDVGALGSNIGLITGVTDVECRELGRKNSDGSYSIQLILTLKQLTVGNSYQSSELWGE